MSNAVSKKIRAGKFWQEMNKYTKPALSWTEPACLNIANKQNLDKPLDS